MTGSVIIRHGHEIVDGRIDYDETPLSWDKADQKAGRRLDRRKAWAFVEDKLCERVAYTTSCSGCSDCSISLIDAGPGCRECGFSGRRRAAFWSPAA